MVLKTKKLQKNILSLSISLALLATNTVNATANDNVFRLEIPAQTLSASLVEIGLQTGASIIYPDQVEAPVSARPIKGRYTPHQAINLLLQGTAFFVKSPSENTFVIHVKKNTEEDDGALVSPEEVAVIGHRTGSRIAKSLEDWSAPLDQISALELERSGAQSLSDLVKFIPAVCGNSTSTAVSNGGDGTTKVTLRGLPANNTLVLMNGSRIAFDGLAGDSVDLNSIAPIVIERIDIYKDGASAIYGSEAIAGVVNIVTRDTYDGFKLEQYIGQTSRKDTTTLTTNALWGREGRRLSGIAALSYYKQDGLYSRDREISSNADTRMQGGEDKRSDATPRARITISDSEAFILKDDISHNTPNASDFRAATNEDRFNYNSQSSTISPSERYGVYSKIKYQINDSMSWRTQLLASKTDATITLASTPVRTAFLDEPVIVSASNIYNPFSKDIQDLRRRVLELPPREQQNVSQNINLSTGVNTDLKGINFGAQIYWNETKAREESNNLIDGSKVAQAIGPATGCQGLEIDNCQPLNLFGPPGSISQQQLDFIRTENEVKGHSLLKGFSFELNGDARLFWGDRIGYAAGGNIRSEKSYLNPLSSARENIIGGVLHTKTEGKRTVNELFGELLLPLISDAYGIKKLEIELASRYTHSSDYGENTSPKIGAKLNLKNGVTFRSTYSLGFRAPSIKELYKDGARSYPGLFDPCSTDDAPEIYIGCNQQSDPNIKQFLTEFKGDTNLKPEKSKSYTFGVVLQPIQLPSFEVSIDAYDIKLTDVIDSDPQAVLNENAKTGMFSELITRDDNGNITLLQANMMNIGERHVQGVDITLGYTHNRLSIHMNSSYIRKYTQQFGEPISNGESTLNIDLAGTFRDVANNGNGTIPKWKANAGVSWKAQEWEINYSANYISSLKERATLDLEDVPRKISPWITHDLNFQKIYSAVDVTLGIDNLLDTPPPFAASAFNDNYDSRTHDIKGRFLYLKLSKHF